MGGKGDDNSSSAMYTPTPIETPKVIQPMNEPAVKKEEKKDPPITEDPSKAAAGDQIAMEETQPYAPPGFGNYGDTNTNMGPLGDALVAGMQEQPGKPGPTNPKYFGQV